MDKIKRKSVGQKYLADYIEKLKKSLERKGGKNWKIKISLKIPNALTAKKA